MSVHRQSGAKRAGGSRRCAPGILAVCVVVLCGCGTEPRNAETVPKAGTLPTIDPKFRSVLDSTAGSDGIPDLGPPKYPDVPAGRPKVPPENFAGKWPPFDWEDASAKPPGNYPHIRFSSTRTFEETSRWIQSTLVKYVRPDEHVRLSDIHFRGCNLEYRYQWLDSPDEHLNEYMYSLNLGDLELTLRDTPFVTVNAVQINANAPTIFRAWRKTDGKWQIHGEKFTRDQPAQLTIPKNDDISLRLGFAFVHATRLCGASIDERN